MRLAGQNFNSNFWKTAGLALWLGGATFVLFAPVIHYDFVNLDDDLYVYDNPVVQQGLTVPGLRWAWCGVHENYWLPVLWVSYLLDTQLFGTGPSGYHFTNVLLHTLNTVLLFLLLARTTGCRWLSFVAAALFGWHPLRVESVAWITERKDVLSTWFGLLALWGYTRCAGFQVSSFKFRAGRMKWHGLALLFFSLGLMSKPMLVSLPVLLLLLDVWPLKRVGTTWAELRQRGWGLVWEKWSWWAVAVVFSVITYYTQSRTGAVISGEKIPFGERLWEVPLAYGFYVVKTFWPKGLAVVYPGLGFSWSGLVLAAVFLGAVTVAVVKARRRCAPLPVGWLWFVVTLLPVIGLVRAGVAQVADRFTYLPSIGLFIMLAWGLADLVSGWRCKRSALVLAGAVALAGCGATTWFQLGHWRNSLTLFEYALAVTANNALAHNRLGFALFQQSRVPEAIVHYEQALQINPEYAEARSNLGGALFHAGRTSEAIAQYEQVLRINPDFAEGHYNLGMAMLRLGRAPEAMGHLERALRVKPEDPEAHNNLAVALFQQGRVPEAIGHLQEVLRLKPADAKARNNLAIALFQLGEGAAAQGKWDEAIQSYQRAVEMKPDNAQAHDSLGLVLSRIGRFAEAVTQYQKALEVDPRLTRTRNHLAWVLATCPDGSVRNGTRAIEHAEEANRLANGKDSVILDTLAAAYAEAGRFSDAVQTARTAVELAQDAGQTEQARPGVYAAYTELDGTNLLHGVKRIQERLELYRAGQPYHERSPTLP